MNEVVSHPKERQTVTPVRYSLSQHKISRDMLDADALKAVLRLVKSGYQAYIVGGGVRDLLLGKQPKDFDVSTDATPGQIKALFRNCRVIGRRFKLAHLYFGRGKIIEVSTFRDLAEWPEPTEGEEAAETGPTMRDNVYGTESTDALRRDLTINGLFYDVTSSTIIDYVGGMEDLKAGIIRVIGDPDVRFREDPVRMIRVVRHASRNGFHIEENCWKSLLKNRELITQSSQVRVFDELKKDFVSGHFLTILSLLGETRLLDYVLPELLENNSALLSDRSDLSKFLERLDDHVNTGGTGSTTVTLAVIALFLSASVIKLRDVANQFEDTGDLEHKAARCFAQLSVPRKEKERVCLLLGMWLRLLRTPPEDLKPGPIKRFSLLDELLFFWRIIPESRDDQRIISVLEKAIETRYPDESDEDNRGRGPRLRQTRRKQR